MKVDGFLKGVGKVGNLVLARTGGETIAREYNPRVSNPNTALQVNQRARLKLASQIAASLSDVIAIPREGLKSARNLFIKKNMQQINAANGNAYCAYENLQLTAGTVGIPGVIAKRDAEVGVTIQLVSTATAAVDRVVYVVYTKNSEAQLQFISSDIVSEAGEAGTFPVTIPYHAGDLILFAYGIKDTTATAAAAYANYECEDGRDVATLLATRKISTGDYQFSKTRGNTLFAGDSETATAGTGYVMIYASASEGGSVTINGQSVNRLAVEKMSSVTLVATAAQGYSFVGWQRTGSNQYESREATLTFLAAGNIDRTAVFEVAAPSGPAGGGGEG